MEKSPCYQCPDRFVGCHASCEKYGAWAAECERIRNERIRFNHAESDYIGYRNGILGRWLEKFRKGDKR